MRDETIVRIAAWTLISVFLLCAQVKVFADDEDRDSGEHENVLAELLKHHNKAFSHRVAGTGAGTFTFRRIEL